MITYAPFEIIVLSIMVSPMFIVAIRKKYRGGRLLSVVALEIYIVFISKYFFFPIIYDKGIFLGSCHAIQLIPFLPFLNQIRSAGWKPFLFQAAGNLFSFVPITFLLAISFPRYQKIRCCIFSSLLISIAIELIQLGINLITGIQNRIIDINDVILNMSGGIVGFFVFKLWHRLEFLVKTYWFNTTQI